MGVGHTCPLLFDIVENTCASRKHAQRVLEDNKNTSERDEFSLFDCAAVLSIAATPQSFT